MNVAAAHRHFHAGPLSLFVYILNVAAARQYYSAELLEGLFHIFNVASGLILEPDE